MPLRPSTSEIEHTRAFLRKWALGRFLAAEKSQHASSLILILDAQDTVRDALAALARKHVLSAPVLDIRRALFLGFCGVRDIVAAFMRTRSRELLVVRAQIGHEPGMPGDDDLQSASGMPHIDFAEQKARHNSAAGIRIALLPLFAALLQRALTRACATQLETFMPGTDGHLLYNSDDPGYNALSLLDVVEGSLLHAGAPGWCVCARPCQLAATKACCHQPLAVSMLIWLGATVQAHVPPHRGVQQHQRRAGHQRHRVANRRGRLPAGARGARRARPARRPLARGPGPRHRPGHAAAAVRRMLLRHALAALPRCCIAAPDASATRLLPAACSAWTATRLRWTPSARCWRAG